MKDFLYSILVLIAFAAGCGFGYYEFRSAYYCKCRILPVCRCGQGDECQCVEIHK